MWLFCSCVLTRTYNFYSHIPCGMWLVYRKTGTLQLISTHTSRVGCDIITASRSAQTYNFYSHIPCGMWQIPSRKYQASLLFLLTHPVWDVTYDPGHPNLFRAFLLTHPVWDVTSFSKTSYVRISISTHTSRVGCDGTVRRQFFTKKISTHTSRVGCDSVHR